jgi:sulfur-carrier protein
MPVTIHVPGYLCEFTEGRGLVRLQGSPRSVGEALLALAALHPGVRDRVMNEQGAVRPHVNVFVGGESIRATGGLATPLPAGADLYIIPAVSGG